MKLIVGPILGIVTKERVRILLETDVDSLLYIVIYQFDSTEKRKEIKSKSIYCNKYRPKVCELNDFLPGKYSYSIEDDERSNIYESNFDIPKDHEDLKMNIVSCNNIEMLKKGDTDLWEDMLKYIIDPSSKKIDMIIHIGDQVYEYNMDVYKRSFEMLSLIQENEGFAMGKDLNEINKNYPDVFLPKETRFDLKDIKDMIKELYRSLYRSTWSHAPLRRILSLVSNQMIMDDHDVRNGFGILSYDKNQRTIEYQIGLCAYEIYQEYQAQLWRNISEDPRVDYRYIRNKDTLIFLMDVRTPRTFLYDEDHPYVGKEQMEALSMLLKDSSIMHLVLICSIPIIMGSEIRTNLARHIDFSYDVNDSWCTDSNKKDHKELLDKLSSWKEKNKDRVIILLGGDIHFYLETEIKNENNEILFTQFVTSPITNLPTKNIECLAQKMMFGSKFKLYGKFHVEHKKSTHARNYFTLHKNRGVWTASVRTE